MRKILTVWAVAMALALGATSCSSSWDDTSDPTPQQQAEDNANNRDNYVPQNDVEGDNYNRRLQVADDPATVLWCTFSFTNPNSELITVPIIGKLTSSKKRPWDNEETVDYGTSGLAKENKPSPDGFFGSSAEYRYGFGPGGQYHDFTGLGSYCTTEPTVFQRDSTEVVFVPADDLSAASDEAYGLLQKGNAAEADRVLRDAIVESEENQPR